jgi:hypothetical protein
MGRKTDAVADQSLACRSAWGGGAMRTYKASAVEPKPLDFDIQEAAQMIAALKRTDPAQRLDTLAVVMKVLIEGHLND